MASQQHIEDRDMTLQDQGSSLQEQVKEIMTKRNQDQAIVGKTPYADHDFNLVDEWTDTQCESVLGGVNEGMQSAMICLLLINQYTTPINSIH